MSWDIFISDFPPEARTTADIPEDAPFNPLGDRSAIIAKIKEVIPEADFSDPSWGVYDGGDYSIEFCVGSDDPCKSIVLLVRGGGNVVPVITRLLAGLQLRAVDSQTGDFFDPGVAAASFREWQAYRDQVVDSSGEKKGDD